MAIFLLHRFTAWWLANAFIVLARLKNLEEQVKSPKQCMSDAVSLIYYAEAN